MHGINRIIACLVAVLVTVLPCPSMGASQVLSPSVVLVLKLVTADRVQPVTGIVVSDDGLVLVPADFVAAPAELVVLDGGTDILGNGRSAQLHAVFDDTGLAVLSVQGLERPGITLSAGTIDEQGLYLEAFPPARQIAEGADPLRLKVDPETPLPYVTGAILDACGLLSGLSVASGMQNLDSGQEPVRIARESLADVFEKLQISVPRAACRVVHQQVEEKAGPTSLAIPGAESIGSAVETPVAETAGTVPAVETGLPAAEQAIEEQSVAEPEPVHVQLPERVPASRVIPWWLQLAGLIVLALLARAIFRRRRQRNGNIDPASDEPDTVQLTNGRREPALRPRTGRMDDELPDFADLPPGCDGFVLFEGVVKDGPISRYFHPVDTRQFDFVIGRGEADVAIENAAISRRHARLRRQQDVMTITDLGSSNGLHVNRVPCLPGEVMHVGAGSELCFGDVCFSLELVKHEASS